MVPAAYQARSVYHFTPLSNLPAILEHGLLSAREQIRRGLPQHSIVWEAIQRHRSAFELGCGPGGFADDYVPFSFCKLSPMLLAVITNKVIDEEAIIHFEFSIDVMESFPSAFTDAAISPRSHPNCYTNPEDLNHLDWSAIDSPEWYPSDPKQRFARLSELLIFHDIPVTLARRIIVWDNAIARDVTGLLAMHHMAVLPVEPDPGCYFFEPAASSLKPAVSGPAQIYQAYRSSVDFMKTRLGTATNPRFASLLDLCQCLRQNLGCLPETAELVGLDTDNRAHIEDVGSHTCRVVDEVLKTPEYQKLAPWNQVLLEIAGYLHDIGKGPKSRWAVFGGRQQIDHNHPIKALPMLERIFSEDLAQADLADIDLICKLVAYHDIIGGIVYSGRRLEELLSIVSNETELDMLVGLSKADAMAINPAWGEPSLRDALRQTALSFIRK